MIGSPLRIATGVALVALLAANASHAAPPAPDWPAAAPETHDAAAPVHPPRPAERYVGAWRLAFQAEGAKGLSGSGFGNILSGVRLDRHFSQTIALGMSLDFVNLKGKDGRVRNLLPEARVEYRIPLSDDVWLPFTYGMGYLAKNGPTVHFTGGIDFAVSESWSLGLEAGPMGWFTHDELVWSLNAGVALGVTL